jgi:hypothetical protein
VVGVAVGLLVFVSPIITGGRFAFGSLEESSRGVGAVITRGRVVRSVCARMEKLNRHKLINATTNLFIFFDSPSKNFVLGRYFFD